MEKVKKYSDLDLVSYLCSKGFKEAGRSFEDHKAYFHFKDTPELTKVVLTFYSGEPIQGDIQSFAYHLRRFRIITNELRKGGGSNE